MFHKPRYLMKHSWREFIDAELLRDGNYDVITSGMLFYDGSKIFRSNTACNATVS